MLHLTGYDLSLEDLRQFRQLGSRTPGHPEFGHTAGIEVTTGPLGQGVANAVGMALAERWLRTTFGSEVCDHRTFVIASDGCLMEGISHEAASLGGPPRSGPAAGRLRRQPHHDRRADRARLRATTRSERFEAYGWRVRYLGEIANDVDGLEAAVREALEYPADGPDAKPNLLVLRSHIGWPAPKLTDTAAAHGNPFGEEEIKATKAILGLPPDQTFWVPDEVREFYGHAGRPRRPGARRLGGPLRGLGRRPRRLGRRARRPRPARVGRRTCPRSPPGPSWRHGTPSTSASTRRSHRLPGLLAGSADLTGNNGVKIKGAEVLEADSPGGIQLHYGIREHAMGAVLTGMAQHGGVLPVGGTFFCFSDYMRPAVRLAALTGSHVVYAWSHDSIGLGEDGPTHQPIEHLASLRAMPGLSLVRPADANETAQAWRLAVEAGGPVGLILTRQDIPVLAGTADAASRAWRAAPTSWPILPATAQIVLVGSGSEVQHCVAAADTLAARRTGPGGVLSVVGPLRAAARGVPRLGLPAVACPC